MSHRDREAHDFRKALQWIVEAAQSRASDTMKVLAIKKLAQDTLEEAKRDA